MTDATRELGEDGLVHVLDTGERKLVRPMDTRERSRVRVALELLPECSHQLLKHLDPTDRAPDDPAETLAQELITEALFRDEHL